MSRVTTHVLDAARGAPAAGVAVRLERRHRPGDATGDSNGWQLLGEGTTDADGRLRDLGPETLDAGDHRLVFATGAWFAEQGRDTFYPEVVVAFRVADPRQHHHVPLLLSPFAYSTYRGS